jgi:putative hydrolase of the HAD superfamily
VTLRAVVFDLDATLTDFRAVEHGVWERTLAHIAAVLPDVDAGELRHRYGELRDPLYTEMLAGRYDLAGYRRAHLQASVEPWGELGDDVIAACVAEREAHVHSARLAAGAAGAVRELRAAGLRVGVLTNGPSRMQRRKLDVIGMTEAVDAICVSEELGAAKPDPRAFAVAAERLGAAAGETAMVGDNVVADIGGALDAGYALAVLVADERPPDLPAEAAHVTGLGDVVALCLARRS